MTLVTIRKIVSSGEGIGWSDGVTYFVPGVIPGETVEILADRSVRRARRATGFRVVEPAPIRREPPCPLFGRCGGCDLLHMPYELQRETKLAILRDLFGQQKAPLAIEPRFVPFPEFGLRTRTKVRILDGLPTFSRRASHERIPFERCPLLHPALNDIVRVDAAERKIGEVSYEYAPLSGNWSPRDPAVEKRVKSESFRVSRGSFFQASEEGADALVDILERTLDAERPVSMLDLFCGVGLFSRFAARRGIAVTGMELSESAAGDFDANLGGGARFVRADLEHDTGLPDADLVVADPPRTGLPERLTTAIASSGAGSVLLISCDAATFVRDTERLRRAGRFALRSLTVVDQFPATRHLEVAALLKRET